MSNTDKLQKFIDSNLNSGAYGTAYAFNTLVAPGFTRLVNSQFDYVEHDMTSARPNDSHGHSYNLIKSTMYLDPKDNPDRGLTKVFLETISKEVAGKSNFISWQITPQVRFEDKRVDGKDFKVYTLISSFSCS